MEDLRVICSFLLKVLRKKKFIDNNYMLLRMNYSIYYVIFWLLVILYLLVIVWRCLLVYLKVWCLKL